MRLSCGEDGVVEVEGVTAGRIRSPLTSLARTGRRPFDGTDGAVGFAFQRGRIESNQLPAPPETRSPFL